MSTMPTSNVIIVPNEPDMSLEAAAVITKMASDPRADYCTAEKLHSFFRNDSLDAVRKALSELCREEYVISVGGVFAVNKLMLPKMKFIVS